MVHYQDEQDYEDFKDAADVAEELDDIVDCAAMKSGLVTYENAE